MSSCEFFADPNAFKLFTGTYQLSRSPAEYENSCVPKRISRVLLRLFLLKKDRYKVVSKIRKKYNINKVSLWRLRQSF